MLVERIDEEDHGINLAFDDPAGDLNVAAMWSRCDTFDLEPNLVTEQIAGGTGRDQLVLGKARPIKGGKSHQVRLLAIVRDDRKARAILMSSLHGRQLIGLLQQRHQMLATNR